MVNPYDKQYVGIDISLISEGKYEAMEIGSVDIAAMSIELNAARVQNSVDIAVLKNEMDAQSEIAAMLITELMGVNVAPEGHVDISV